MTRNQIEYAKLQETKRTNLANEAILHAYNTGRLAIESSQLSESQRHNKAVESAAFSELTEGQRHNRAVEAATLRELDYKAMQAESALQNAASNSMNALTNSRNADTQARLADISLFNAQVNAENARTNARNADSNYLQAQASLRNAESNAQNAVSNRISALASQTSAEAHSRSVQETIRHNIASEGLQHQSNATAAFQATNAAISNMIRERELTVSQQRANAESKRADAYVSNLSKQNAKIDSEIALNEARTSKTNIESVTLIPGLVLGGANSALKGIEAYNAIKNFKIGG